MKEYLDKKIDLLLSEDETPSDTLKLFIGQAYLNLRAICFNNEIFLDECIAIAYEKIKEEKEDDGI